MAERTCARLASSFTTGSSTTSWTKKTNSYGWPRTWLTAEEQESLAAAMSAVQGRITSI